MASGRNIVYDDKLLRQYEAKLSKAGRGFDKRASGAILRKVLKPTLQAVQRNAPVGPTPEYQSSVRVRGSRKGTPRAPYEINRGGATRNAARILIVDGQGGEVAAGLVGISKAKNQAGYRTHLITRANLHRRTPNDFLSVSERQTEGQVLEGFQKEAVAKVQNDLK